MPQIFRNKIKIYQDYREKNLFNSNINIFCDSIKNISLNKFYKNLIYYPSSTKEWFSSVYSYNKPYIKSLIVYDGKSNLLLKSYANMLKNKVQKFKRRRNNKIRYSANKLYLSKAELKQTNTKLVVLVYLFNKEKLTIQRFLLKLSKFIKAYLIMRLSYKHINKGKYVNKKASKLRYSVLYKVHSYKRLKKNYYKRLKKNNQSSFNIVYNKLSSLLLDKKTLTTNSIPYTKRLKNLFKEENLLLDTAKNLNFNTFKFSNLSLTLENLGILRLLQKIYGKKVEFKVVDLKSVHLNSDIFSSAVALKLRDRHNKAVRVLRKAILKMVKIPDLHTLITFDDNKPFMDKSNILNTIDQQVVSGVRFEAAGRLTRRLTAMRSVFKYRYVGSLKNIRSSFNSKPSTILRGVLKSNAQYTIINSKTRNGTFGLKGWVSTH
jgi:hypothetical protein